MFRTVKSNRSACKLYELNWWKSFGW